MAYEKKPIRMVAGGLNLLYPGNQIADDEAQELVNFSIDSFGALRSRRGHAVRFSVGANPVRMVKAMGDIWTAAGGALYRNDTSVISGLSTDKVGVVGFLGYVWAMSAADQRKSDGSSNDRWLPEAPEDAPTIAPATAVETVVVDFSAGFTVDPAGDEHYNNGFLQIDAQETSEYSAEKEAAADLGTGHSLDDVFRIRVWAKEWSRINGITFQIDVNDGSFEKDYYTAVMKQKDIAGGRKDTVTFYLRKRPQNVDIAAKDKKRYGHFERIGTTAGQDYSTVVSVRVKVNFNDNTKIRFEEWVLVGDIENTLEGDDFRACYTYTTDDDHESNRSPFSEPITVNRTGIDLTGMVASPDAQVTGQNIYLTGGTLGRVLRVNTDPVVGATYDIRESDDDLTELGLVLENDHDDPPAVGGLIGPHYGRLIAFGNSRIYWSHVNKPFAFRNPDGADGDWAGADEAVGELLAATMRPGIIFFYGRTGVAVLQDDPGGTAPSFHRSAIQSGIQSPNGVCQTQRGDFANFANGLYQFGGDSGQELSRKIKPVFLDSFDPTKAAIGYHNDIVWISDGTITYKLDLTRGWWVEDSRVFSCFLSDGDVLLGATPDGDVLELETGFSDDGAGFTVSYLTKSHDCGLMDSQKRFEDFTIWANTGGATLTVSAILKGPDQTIALGTISSNFEDRFVLQFDPQGEGVDARNCAIQITGATEAGEEVIITQMALNYDLIARQGKSFDTGEMNFGDHRVKLLREVVLDLNNAASVSMLVKSDRPQPMANRATETIASTSDRRMQPVVFDSQIIGRLFRLVLDSEDMKCYGGKALYQAFGTYLEGGDGEYYLSDALDFGTERVKLIREMEIIYAGAQGTIAVETDLPGNALAERGSGTFPAVADEQSVKVRCEDNIKGRLIRVRVTSAGALRIEAIRINLKMIGEPGATGWQWVSLPLIPTTDGIWADISFPPDAPG